MLKELATSDNRVTEIRPLTHLTTFEEVYRQYWAELFDIAYQRTNSVEKAEELIQDLFVTLWEKRAHLEIKESIAGYLHTALKYRILNYLRHEKVRSSHLNQLKKAGAAYAASLEEEIYGQELESAFTKQINNLPIKCRQAFVLSRTENLSFKEIAVKLNVSVNTVEKHVGKALKILRFNLRDFTLSVLFLFNAW